MDHALKIAMVLTLLMVIAFVVVHPLVDLEPTVSRHSQASVSLFVAVVLGRIFTSRLVASCRHYIVPDCSASLRKDFLDPIDLTCIRLC